MSIRIKKTYEVSLLCTCLANFDAAPDIPCVACSLFYIKLNLCSCSQDEKVIFSWFLSFTSLLLIHTILCLQPFLGKKKVFLYATHYCNCL